LNIEFHHFSLFTFRFSLFLSQCFIKAIKDQLNFFTEPVIEAILGGKPKVLCKVKEDYQKFIVKYVNLKFKIEIQKLIDFLFDYDDFSKKGSIYSEKNWGAYRLAAALKVRSCLYCNRNYIVTVRTDSEDIVRPEFDHFFPQCTDPILALSFYNLIPSCHICNSNLKGRTKFSLQSYFHPYLQDFSSNNVYFKYRPLSPEAFQTTSEQLEVILDTRKAPRLSRQINRNIKLFQLNNIYNNHLDIVTGLLHIQRIANKKRLIDIYKNVFHSKYYKNGEKEIYELIIRNYYSKEEYCQKPMAKFEKDIAMEIGLIQ